VPVPRNGGSRSHPLVEQLETIARHGSNLSAGAERIADRKVIKALVLHRATFPPTRRRDTDVISEPEFGLVTDDEKSR
jgi:hypothetical protein